MNSFTYVGQGILLVLLQIGGISLITFTILIVSRFIRFGLSGYLKAQQFEEIEIGKEGKNLLPFILMCTIVIETVGALILYTVFRHAYPWYQALLLAFFQSISSFCNIGVSMFGFDVEQYANNNTVLLTTTVLMFCGIIGFPALKELYDCSIYIKNKRRGKLFSFSLQTKIIIYGSCLLTMLGMVLLCITEHNGTLTGSYLHQLVTLLFHAVSFRSAGFLSVPVGQLAMSTILIMMLYGFIGSSPGSTGSGVKITSFAIVVATIKTLMSGSADIKLSNRSIPIDQAIKSFTIIALGITWIFISTLLLSITEQEHSLLEILLEATSAFTNQGISLGLTEQLTHTGKYIIMLGMLVGRIGPLAFILAWAKRSLIESKKNYRYPEERIMLE
jgi:trk system potassium uptake protein TrkH